VATFSFAKQGISENSPLNRTRGNIGARLKAIEVNRRYLTNLTTRLLASVRRVLLSFGMRFRTYKNADLTVSEVGFGLWTISTGWWGNFTEGEAIALMHKAFDLGITLFDAADTYGNGLSEELIAKAFPNQRDEIVIATKVGYDFVHYGEARGRGQREIPQDFSPEAITRATDAALKRLKTDRIDLLQLHNIRMEQVYDDTLWMTLGKLKSEGKVRYYGIALGPAIGWLYEGVNCIRERDMTSLQHIYNMLEQHPGRAFHQAATEAAKDTMFLIRVTHSSGMLEGKYTAETIFPPTDHRSHRPRSWLLNGIKKIDKLRFLENSERTLGQAALQWLLADDRVASTLPNIYNEEQLVEFAKAPESPPLTSDDMAKIDNLYAENFGIEEEPPKFKGTMELSMETAAATA
jgi:aryl-alcohol dehydrogenase-like predicted oxidoreductase